MKTKIVSWTVVAWVLGSTWASAAPSAPAPKRYLETLLESARGALSVMSHRERNVVSWTRGRWQALETPEALIAWFEDAGAANPVHYRLRDARRQAQSLTLGALDADAQGSFLAPLAGHEARVLRYALEQSFGERCATFHSSQDYRTVYVGPTTDSPQRCRISKGTYVTLLDQSAGWAQVRTYSAQHAVTGYMQVDGTFRAYAAPVGPPALLATGAAEGRSARELHLGLLATVAEASLTRLDHRSRGTLEAFRAHWGSLREADALMSFLESNLSTVYYTLRGARTWAAHLSGIEPEALQALGRAEGKVLRQALSQAASRACGSFESSQDWRAIYAERARTSDVVGHLPRDQYVQVLDGLDGEWIKVRYYDASCLLEGYMPREGLFRLWAAPVVPAAPRPSPGPLDRGRAPRRRGRGAASRSSASSARAPVAPRAERPLGS
ncbi:MAG: hypothetical protein R3F62_11005 [Planctomycetota bacterium]